MYSYIYNELLALISCVGYLHVLAEGAGVGVGLVAAVHSAEVGLIRGVHVRVLLPVRAVGEPPLAALKLAPKRLLTCWAELHLVVGKYSPPRGSAFASRAKHPTQIQSEAEVLASPSVFRSVLELDGFWSAPWPSSFHIPGKAKPHG